MSDMISTKDAAKFLGLQPDTLRVWRYRDKKRQSTTYLPYVKVGKSVKYKISDLEEYVLKNRQTSLNINKKDEK